MKMCQPHWDELKEVVRLKGMLGLVAKSGDEAIWNRALELGGLYLMGQDDKGNEYCPLCEVNAHITVTQEQKDECKCPDGFKNTATCWINGVTDTTKKACEEQGLELEVIPVIEVMFSCDECKLTDIKVKVLARAKDQDIKDWMDKTILQLMTRHSSLSPNCHPKKFKNIKIPIEGAGHVGGPTSAA